MSKYKKTPPIFFLFPEGQMHQNQSVYFKFHKTVFKTKQNSFVTKCTDTLTLCCKHLINLKSKLIVRKNALIFKICIEISCEYRITACTLRSVI